MTEPLSKEFITSDISWPLVVWFVQACHNLSCLSSSEVVIDVHCDHADKWINVGCTRKGYAGLPFFILERKCRNFWGISILSPEALENNTHQQAETIVVGSRHCAYFLSLVEYHQIAQSVQNYIHTLRSEMSSGFWNVYQCPLSFSINIGSEANNGLPSSVRILWYFYRQLAWLSWSTCFHLPSLTLLNIPVL